jgi:tRNA(Ile)-lysidine synthase
VAFCRTELRRYRDLLYARAAQADPPANWELLWDGSPLELPAGCGRVRLVPSGITPVRARLRFRRGGEALKPVGSEHTRELRDLFQQVGLPPWERGRLPLLCDEHGELLAVGDLWLSEAGAAWLCVHERRFEWLPHGPQQP